MTKSTPEAELTRRIRVAIAKRYPGAVDIKISPGRYQQAGLPDLLVLLPPTGRAVWLEVKAPRAGESDEHARARVTPLQAATLARLETVGCVARVVLSVEDALTAVELASRLS